MRRRHKTPGTKKPGYRHLPVVLALVSAALLLSAFMGRSALPGIPVENRASEQRELPPEIERAVRLATLDRRYRIPVLLYHYVEYVEDHRDLIRRSLDTRPDIFEAQVVTMLDAGYTFLTASELSEIIDARRDMPGKPVILTFDDGYRDFYTDVFPILKKYGVKATAYISPGLLNRNNYMLNSQVAEIVRSGLVEIGAHTVHHVPLAGASRELVKKEVSEAKRMLEDRFGVRVVSFAYPYGSFDAAAVEAVKDAGYTTAASTIIGTEVYQANRLFLFRVRAGERTGVLLTDYLDREVPGPR